MVLDNYYIIIPSSYVINGRREAWRRRMANKEGQEQQTFIHSFWVTDITEYWLTGEERIRVIFAVRHGTCECNVMLIQCGETTIVSIHLISPSTATANVLLPVLMPMWVMWIHGSPSWLGSTTRSTVRTTTATAIATTNGVSWTTRVHQHTHIITITITSTNNPFQPQWWEIVIVVV